MSDFFLQAGESESESEADGHFFLFFKLVHGTG